MQKLLVLLIRPSHFLILAFVIFGWLFSAKAILIAHAIFVPLVILQWKLNNGRCLLTDLEHFILKKPVASAEEDSEGFVKNILKHFCNPLPSDQQILLLMYVVMALSLSLSLFKIIF